MKAKLYLLGAAAATRGQTNISESRLEGEFLSFSHSITFDDPQQCWSLWDRVLGLAVQLLWRMGGRHLLLVGAGEVRDGGVAGALHPLLLLTVLPLSWRGGTLCHWRGGSALLKKIILQKFGSPTIKLSHGCQQPIIAIYWRLEYGKRQTLSKY